MWKKLLSLTLCVSTLLLGGCGMTSNKIRFGTAALGGMYHSFGSAFTQLVSTEDIDCQMEMKTTAGSAANLRLLSDGYIELGIAQMDLTADAYKGTGIFEGKEYQGFKAIAGLYTEACQIVVRADSSIHSLNDLQGKTISIGEEDSGTERNANQILKSSGLSSELVHTVNLDYAQAASQLQSGDIDALFCTAGVQTTVIDELSRQCDIRLLSIDKDCLDKLLQLNDCYSTYTIPADTYNGQTEEATTLGVQAVLLASDKLSEKTVEQLTKLLFSHAQDIQYSIPVDLQMNEISATQGITIPFHPGAAAYYAKQNIQVSTE